MVELVQSRSTMRIIAITGPRQTGKTTLALQACRVLHALGHRCHYVVMDDPTANTLGSSSEGATIEVAPTGDTPDRAWLIALWERARAVARSGDELVLVLDEIHSVPGWSGVVKGLWDRDRREHCPLRVVILGSAPWKMMTGLSESLMGRFDVLPASHWSFNEMAEAFDLTVDEYLFYGGYPGSFSREAEVGRLSMWRRYVTESIIAPAIERDIIGFTRVRKPALMRQLMDLGAHYSGQQISYNKLLGQLQDAGNTVTLARYLDLLKDAGLMIGFTRYIPVPHAGRAAPPKLNVLNSALMTASSGYTFEEARANSAFWGRIVESAVGAHLFNTRGPATKVHFWRDPPHEVDFVIARGPHIVGIEVKSGQRRNLRGLKAFSERFPEAATVVVGPADMPVSELLSLGTEEWIEELCA